MSYPSAYIAGAGLTGATIAWFLKQAGHKVCIFEKRGNIAGNCYTEEVEGIMVHKYGPHIFHTNNDAIWNFVNKFTQFNNYTHQVVANYEGEVYPFPINLHTVNQYFRGYLDPPLTTPQGMKDFLESRAGWRDDTPPKNAWEYVCSKIGHELARRFFLGYTEKQWGRPMDELPIEIVSRIPVRYSWDNRYFTDRYQGIPTEGYTKMVENMLQGVDVCLNSEVDHELIQHLTEVPVFYTGPIDAYFGYKLGKLDYRSLEFEEVIEKGPSPFGVQGCAQMNYTGPEKLYTRIVEHKHFATHRPTTKTVITREYPAKYSESRDPYYPIRDEKNTALYNRYLDLAAGEAPHVIFCGRLGAYQYLNMDQAIGAAMNIAKKYLEEHS